MADGSPKDYSSIFSEDSSFALAGRYRSPPPPTIPPPMNNLHKPINKNLPTPIQPSQRLSKTANLINNNNNNHNQNHHHQQQHLESIQSKLKTLDGGFIAPKHREKATVDLRKVVEKLNLYSKENDVNAHSMDTLNHHYSSVFRNRRRTMSTEQSVKEKRAYRVFIQYSGEKETYVVKVDQNNLKSIKNKMPIKGNYRYFFRSRDDITCEELEYDSSIVPYHDKDNQKHIYCQVFPIVSMNDRRLQTSQVRPVISF